MNLPLWFHQHLYAANMTGMNSAQLNEAFLRAKPHYDFSLEHPHAEFHPRAFHDVHPPLKLTASHNRRSLEFADVPESFDWRDTDMIAPVVEQGLCNSCYVLTAADNLNYWTKQLTGSFGVSGQTLLDCSGYGCNGGVMESVFHWHGPYGSDKMYDGKTHTCDKPLGGVYVNDYVTLSDLDGEQVESNLANAIVQYGPIPVGIDSTSSRFITYKDGVIEADECNKEPNHAVTVVGFTPEYWVIKNSWGEHWGEDGYGKISRGQDTCGIDSYASFATSVVWRDLIP
jgi:C1A family cysteine protease